ncbi:SVP1-like protein [Lachnellula suecica]|uniref:SVP1-like protein n=1 Tax=Lachnellula suecica TaxID=602035 RepID=A0A8T9BTW5_9HELO|nr:SVP1-like protein [Lachnellula suecica]
MNTRPAIENPNNPVALSASFNQDASCFTVGLENGFSIFGSEPCQLRGSRDFNTQGIGLMAMLGKTNYVAITGGGKNPKYTPFEVIIWDELKSLEFIRLRFRSHVRGVKISRTHIVVALQNSIHVYKLEKAPKVRAVFETSENPFGLCCLTPKTLAFPGRTPGQVQLVELSTQNVSIIPAHGSALRAIDISRDGEVLATASETGTLVRVFATGNCAKLAELRRGVDHATIFSLAIAPSGQLLAVTSDKSTLHIFDIPHPSKPARAEGGSASRMLTSQSGGGNLAMSDADTSHKWGFLGRIPLLPRVFSDVYSFASAHFEIGDEPTFGGPNSPPGAMLPPPKGVIGWTTDESLIVIGAGRGGKWEKFVIAEGEDGKRYCVRSGWKNYLGVN